MEYPRLGLIRIESFDHFLAGALDQMHRATSAARIQTSAALNGAIIGDILNQVDDTAQSLPPRLA
jgi:hypothetical protein